MTKNTQKIYLILVTSLLYITPGVVIAGFDLPTLFSNSGGIKNTRHNLTQSPITNNGNTMDSFRNDYAAVCVYCHTPHGANTTVDLPLWNRTMNGNTYTTYDTLGTTSITSDFVQPGINSLSCLSCHDGTLGVDSIINMPGSGGYNKAIEQNNNKATVDTWLNNWTTEFGGVANSHQNLSTTGCLVCHAAPDTGNPDIFPFATDFKLFAIGTDLTNDHPVGVQLPSNGPGTDFVSPTGITAGIQWFDEDGDNRPDSDEVRFYDTGSGPRVECASCHDPHGVAPGGFGTVINKSFLRKSNDNSQVCLTCHVK